jgi:putative transposase
VRQPSPLYKRHRFPGELISHAVLLYFRFLLSYRDVEELLAERGITVSYGTVRRWCRKLGQAFADGVRRRRSRPGDKRHIDEVQLKINGKKHWLWRAVDRDGLVLDILVQARRNQEAAEAFLRCLVEGQGYRPRLVITDRLASHPPAVRRVLPGVEQRRSLNLNSGVERDHGPVKQRLYPMRGFKRGASAAVLGRGGALISNLGNGCSAGPDRRRTTTPAPRHSTLPARPLAHVLTRQEQEWCRSGASRPRCGTMPPWVWRWPFRTIPWRRSVPFDRRSPRPLAPGAMRCSTCWTPC